MPSRRGLFLIAGFWLATMAYVAYRDLWPRWFGDDPPTIQIDLTDEATLSLPVRWDVFRGEQKIGSLSTQMHYIRTDDSFQFVSTYTDLVIEVKPFTLVIPKLETTTRISRGGDLREQRMVGKLEAWEAGLKLAEAGATVRGRVVNGELVGSCKLDSPFLKLDRPMPTVPVMQGRVMNPMQPLNRLSGVRPGRRWAILQNDPLAEAIYALVGEVLKQTKIGLPDRKPTELIAEVKRDPEPLDRPIGRVMCWVIEYRGDAPVARTWVSVEDGRVLRQEAFGMGDLRLDRED